MVVLSIAVVVAPGARAYGFATWQAAFSGNFNDPKVGSDGFWGWCDFLASSSDGLSGSVADCTATFYHLVGGVPGGALFSERIDGTAWSTLPTTFPIAFSSSPDFFITDGTVTISGPTITQLLLSGATPPPGSGCTLAGTSATCPIPVWEILGLYDSDTGLPAQAGHFSLKGLAELLGFPLPPGTQINLQVTKVGG